MCLPEQGIDANVVIISISQNEKAFFFVVNE